MNPCPRCQGRGRLPTGEELLKARKWLGLSRREVGELAGVNGRYLYNLEKGVRPAPVELVAFYEANGVRFF